MFKIMYSVVLGDFGDFHSALGKSKSIPTSKFPILVWFVFFIATLLNVIIMLNLLISVLSETYSNAKSKQKANRNFELVQIISTIDVSYKEKIDEEGGLCENYNYLYVIKPMEFEDDNVIKNFLLLLRF